MADVPKIFELGYITVGGQNGTIANGTQIYVEEITVNTTRELHSYYTTDSFKPKAVRPGRVKYEFTIKKAEDRSESGQGFRKLFEAHTGTGMDEGFNLTVYALNVGDDVNTPTEVFEFTGCRLSRDNLGNFDTSKPVQNDLEGQATNRIVKYS